VRRIQKNPKGVAGFKYFFKYIRTGDESIRILRNPQEIFETLQLKNKEEKCAKESS